MHLYDLGWSKHWTETCPSIDLNNIVRITEKHRGSFRAVGEHGKLTCFLSGKLEFGASTAAELPAIGDWCRISPPFQDAQGNAAIIEEVIPRRTSISRLAAGDSVEEQVLVANVDFAFITSSANSELNISRLYRYIYLAKKGNVEPILVISKADLLEDRTSLLEELKKQFKDLRILLCSSLNNEGLEELHAILKAGSTAVFIGSSGVGKSSLVNALLQKEVQATKAIRSFDDKGQHTTSSGSLHFTSTGAMIVDTPGLRELQIFGDEEALGDLFQDVEKLTVQCKFSNCTHSQEPGCAILKAVEEGELSDLELKRYDKMRREIDFANRRVDQKLAAEQKSWHKKINTQHRQKKKFESKF